MRNYFRPWAARIGGAVRFSTIQQTADHLAGHDVEGILGILTIC
jgi:hypothetical protein